MGALSTSRMDHKARRAPGDRFKRVIVCELSASDPEALLKLLTILERFVDVRWPEIEEECKALRVVVRETHCQENLLMS